MESQISDVWAARSRKLLSNTRVRLSACSVIDLAAGTGEPGISLAQRVGPSGAVTAVDQSADLLEIAADRARSKKLENFTIRQADAHQLPFPNQSFDLATCRFGVMFFSDVTRAPWKNCAAC